MLPPRGRSNSILEAEGVGEESFRGGAYEGGWVWEERPGGGASLGYVFQRLGQIRRQLGLELNILPAGRQLKAQAAGMHELP